MPHTAIPPAETLLQERATWVKLETPTLDSRAPRAAMRAELLETL